MLRLSRSTIRSLIAAGFVTPARGARGAWLFSFQDLIVLRTAQALADANVPQRRITRSMRELRRHLPDAMPLSGLRISAVADRVVIREGDSRWQAESGQYLLGFDGDPADGTLSVIERDNGHARSRWRAAVVRQGDGAGGRRTSKRRSRRTSTRSHGDPAFLDAYINLGRLLHEVKRLGEAERVYRDALKVSADDPMLLYNLGVLLDDMDRVAEAKDAYESALASDPDFADCHYNLSLLCERLAKPKEALRHMARYRVLTKSRAR